MANYHIFEQAADGKTVSVVFHIPAPVSQNDAKIDYKSVIVDSFAKAGTTVDSEVTDITVEELNKIKAGEIVEVVKSVRYSSRNLTPTQKISEITEAYNTLVISMDKDIKDKYLLYGTTKTIVEEV